MKRSSGIMLILLGLVSCLAIGQSFYLANLDHSETIASKKAAVHITGLPNVYLGFQSTWLRHSGLTTVGQIFPDDGTLLSPYQGSFVISIQGSKSP